MKSRIKTITVSEFNGKKSYSALLENGIAGYYDIKQAGELKDGDDVDYTAEERTNKKGGKYNLLTLTKVVVPEVPVAPGAKIERPVIDKMVASKSLTELKFNARMECLKLAVSAYIAGKIDFEQVKEHFVQWTSMADASIDELKNA